MKHISLGIFFLFLNFLVIFVNIYFANLTKKIEKENKNAELQITLLKETIKINELEYAAHLNPTYLKKLEEIYLLHNLEDATTFKIITRKEFNANGLEKIFKVKAD